jgi:hypothetical protein
MRCWLIMIPFMTKTMPEDIEVRQFFLTYYFLEQNKSGTWCLRSLLLRLANRIPNLKVCDDSEISSGIEMLLTTNINRKAVSSRYIHYALPAKFKRKYQRKREIISDSNGDVDQGWECQDSIHGKGNLWKIKYWLNREQLLRNLEILGPPVSKSDVCFRITIDLASRSVTDHAIGYGLDSTGFFWLPLWKPGM